MIQKLTPDNRQPYDRPNDDVTERLVQSDDKGPQIFVRTSSLRFNRKKFTVAVTAFVVGAVLILMQSPYKNQFVTPGSLNSTHAQIIASQTGDQCSACHEVGDSGFGQWLTSMIRPGKNIQACQSQLCMKCHSQSINETFATKPHNLAPEKLRNLTDKYQNRFVSFSTSFDPPVDKQGNIECSSCHREHHGQSDLMAMTDQQCQTCHVAKYDSFESNHPEFSNWPQRRRQRIAFDHTSHGFKHFPGQNEKFDCSMCHIDDRLKNVKLLAGYETACAKCHQNEINTSSETGIQLLAMPMLDMDAISDEKLDVGVWPDSATGDFDGRVPELMRLLLFKDEHARSVLEKHGPDFEFGDLDPSDSSDVVDAVKLAWAIKYLIFDLATGGETEIRNRIEFALQRSIPESEYHVLTHGLDASVFGHAANRWLPGLAIEVPNHRARSVNASGVAGLVDSQDPFCYFKDDDPGMLKKNPLVELMQIGKRSDDDDGEINNPETAIKGSEYLADSSLHQGESSLQQVEETNQSVSPNWLVDDEASSNKVSQNESVIQTPDIADEELLAKNPLSENPKLNSQNAKTVPNNDTSNKNPEHHVADTSSSGARSSAPLTLNKSETLETDDPEILVANPLSAINDSPDLQAESDTPGRLVQQESSNSPRPLNSESEKQLAQNFVENVAQLKDAQADRVGDQFEINVEDSEQFVSASPKSGWFRNDRLCQISYRPVGHADRFLATMMDVVSATANVDNNPAAIPYFNKMTADSSVGMCNKCHTIDSNDTEFQVNWRTQYRDPLLRSFTRFSHGAHSSQTELKDCTACHELDEMHANANTFKHFDATDTISNFAPIEKSNCTSCHFNGSAERSCTQCHNYHIGSRVTLD